MHDTIPTSKNTLENRHIEKIDQGFDNHSIPIEEENYFQ